MSQPASRRRCRCRLCQRVRGAAGGAECTQHEEVLVEHEEMAMLSQPEHRRRRSPCRSRRAGEDVDVVSARAYEELVVVPNAHNMRRCW